MRIDENTIIGQGINLSSAGYGTAKITAKKGDEIDILDSKDQILRFSITKSDTPSSIIDHLYGKYLEFLRRRK